MTFIHNDPEFADLLRIVAEARQIPVALIEKDYWVTHALWALQELGVEVWFKGGTSLSKGFGLIQRFSEDLDLKLEGGKVDLPAVSNWKSKERGPLAERRAFFEAVAGLPLVDLQIRLDPASLGSLLGPDHHRWATCGMSSPRPFLRVYSRGRPPAPRIHSS